MSRRRSDLVRYRDEMGHRDELLKAAQRCLETKGYAGTTARDLVEESGTNLASIGYHFGSKEALLDLALRNAQFVYVQKVLDAGRPARTGTLGAARMRETWQLMVEAFDEQRPVIVAFFEAIARAERSDDLRKHLAESYQAIRAAVAAEFESASGGASENAEQNAAVAALLVAICEGLMIQWLIDPDALPSGESLFDAARVLFSDTATRAQTTPSSGHSG